MYSVCCVANEIWSVQKVICPLLFQFICLSLEMLVGFLPGKTCQKPNLLSRALDFMNVVLCAIWLDISLLASGYSVWFFFSNLQEWRYLVKISEAEVWNNVQMMKKCFSRCSRWSTPVKSKWAAVKLQLHQKIPTKKIRLNTSSCKMNGLEETKMAGTKRKARTCNVNVSLYFISVLSKCWLGYTFIAF